jgi:hypothetical protein
MHLTPELLQDENQLTAEPISPDASPFGDIPRPIWIAFLSAWALLFTLFLIFFATGGPATLDVVTSSFFGLMLLGLPAALGAQAKSTRRLRPRFIVTRNGPLPIGAAAAQILLIPVGAVIGLSAFIALAM